MIGFLPLLVVLSVVAAMVASIWQFDRHRWEGLKDRLAQFWPENRRAVMHLETDNGFIMLGEFLIKWSDLVLKFAWISATPALALGVEAAALAAILIALGFVLRSGVVLLIAKRKAATFSGLMEYDGFGTFHRTARDWTLLAMENRSLLRQSSAVAAILILLLVI
jgi:hypothetical protein